MVLADDLAPIEPSQDGFLNTAQPTNNFGGADNFRVDGGRHAFVEFVVADIPAGHVVDTAMLTLTVKKAGAAGAENLSIRLIQNVAWDENAVTFDDNPLDALWDSGTVIATLVGGPIAVNASHDFDVKNAITANGTFLFGLATADSAQTKYFSKEATTAAYHPMLTITTKLDDGPSDTTAPVFDANIADININATGALTDIRAAVSAANITAIDETDVAPIIAKIKGDSNLSSGIQTVTLKASDAAGNVAETDVTVNITPLLTLSGDESIAVGTTAAVSVGLTGPAVTYPVTLDYTIAGDAVIDSGGSLTFDDAIAQNVDVSILGEALTGDTGVLTLSGAINAQLPLVKSTTISAVSGNVAPTIRLELKQSSTVLAMITADNADVIHYIDATAGDVTVNATINDVNPADTHSTVWTNSSVELDVPSEATNSFVFSPDLLSGNFDLRITAEEDNTTDLLSTTLVTTIKVISELPDLPTDDTDTDKDGIFDKDEGYKDSDGDGIVDYLDSNSDTTFLPISSGELHTTTGLSLSLGSVSTTAQGISADSATITQADLDITAAGGDANTLDTGYLPVAGADLINFKISGLSAGGVARIVYPLADNVVITNKTEYRKYTPWAGWTKFVSDGDNEIASAAKDEFGDCPAPNSVSYVDGLAPGSNCLQLTILDGGIYDADNAEDGSIEDPGVLAEANAAPQWDTDIIDLGTIEVNENSSVIVTEDLATLASDSDGDELTFAKASGPDWLTVDASGALSADLIDVVADDYVANVSVTDSKAQTAQATVNLSVMINMAPVLAKIIIMNEEDKEEEKVEGLAEAFEGKAYSAELADFITDAERDSYTVTKITGPNWLTISAAGELTGKPHAVDVGYNSFTVEIVDAKGAKMTTTLPVTVKETGSSATEGAAFSAVLFAMLGLVSLRRRKQK